MFGSVVFLLLLFQFSNMFWVGCAFFCFSQVMFSEFISKSKLTIA